MSNDVTIYETTNSIYTISGNKYFRTTKDSRPRAKWEILNLTKNLKDEEWIELEDIEEPVKVIKDNGKDILQIRYKGSKIGILTSPLVRQHK